MSSDHGVLTVSDAAAIGDILRACESNKRVGWLLPGGDVATGTIRCVCDGNGFTSPRDMDVRAMHVRITTSGGLEHFMPMADAITHVRETTMVLDYQS